MILHTIISVDDVMADLDLDYYRELYNSGIDSIYGQQLNNYNGLFLYDDYS